MSWELFTGDGQPRRALPDQEAWRRIPKPPPWRIQDPTRPPVFDLPDGLTVAVNAALHLRRPLLLTGAPGSGKSTLAQLLAHELELGKLLQWHITSKSTLTDALYQYDALGRLHAVQARPEQPSVNDLDPAAEPRPAPGSDGDRGDDVARFVTLGPLGTALASRRVRAVLIDEIDKSDLDLPGDLLNVMENGHFTIPVLDRADGGPFRVKGADHDMYEVAKDGTVSLDLENFPVIVFTSNRERTFPAPFLRRCVRFEMPTVSESALTRIVIAHLEHPDAAAEHDAIAEFARRVGNGDQLAVNQLLEFVYLVSGADSGARAELKKTILQDLGDT
ncbi:AAA family ATPase [Streptomyces europaeiscabiei]|uniref:AAA family ATPase n=1 Tax=Streptomyces europaeiscabiei TaxID=146819 RepID=UPI0029B04C54|nr:MoxR family ATPase [Streptomyces europaeiscabiei]MDX2525201.1 MoxR family ATPase [Streptomyces europaeiscabiei]